MKVYVVGGAGYIGSRLVPHLRTAGWEPEVIDAGIYGNVPEARRQDVRDMDPPGDGAPVVWLATIHREPHFVLGDATAEEAWKDAMTAIMARLPARWALAGHPLLYISSMLSAQPRDPCMYAAAKGGAVGGLMELNVRFRALRFGTVWGDLNNEPRRLETAVNRALLGDRLDEGWSAWTTYIWRAVEAICGVLAANSYTGTIENVIDENCPTTAARINEVLETNPVGRPAWEQLFVHEVRKTGAADRASYVPATEQLARYYGLPLLPPGDDSLPVDAERGVVCDSDSVESNGRGTEVTLEADDEE